MERFGATENVVVRANLLEALVGAWGFEPQTPTVSTRTRRRVERVKVFCALKHNPAAREVTHTLLKLYKAQARSGKIPAKQLSLPSPVLSYRTRRNSYAHYSRCHLTRLTMCEVSSQLTNFNDHIVHGVSGKDSCDCEVFFQSQD